MNDPLDTPDGAEAVRVAKQMVHWPAVGLIATGCITLILVVIGSFSIGSLPEVMQAEYQKIEKDPKLTAQQKQDMVNMLKGMESGITVVVIGSMVLLAIGAVVVIVGGIKLKNLSSRGWAKTSAVLSMIPFCVSYSCLLGLPFGIWAFVVMGKPQVKAGFAAQAKGSGQVTGERDDFDSDSPPI